MNRIRMAIVLCSILAANAATAQETIRVDGTARVVPGQDGAPITIATADDMNQAPRGTLSWWAFNGAGRRELSSVGENARLVYVLATKDAQPVPEDGKVEFDGGLPSTRWLCEELKKRFPLLERIDPMTTLTRRDGTAAPSYSAEVRVELTGKREIVTEAERFLDSYVSDNRRLVMIESVVMTRSGDGEARPAGEVKLDLLSTREFDLDVADRRRLQDFEVVCAPKITTFGQQRAQIQVTNQISYLERWDVALVRDQKIASPEIATLLEGIALELTPTIVGRDVHLEVSLNLSKVQRIEQVTETIADLKRDVTIDRPVVENLHWACPDARLTLDLPALRISGLTIRDKDKVQNVDVLLRATIVAPEDVGEDRTLGDVIGFDPTTREVFFRAKREGAATELRARRIEILRDSNAVGHGTVIEGEGTLLRVRLEDGEAKAGDVAAGVK